MKHIDFSTMYISTVEDMGDGEGECGFNVEIKRQPHFGHNVVQREGATHPYWWCTDCDRIAPFHVCDTCGVSPAEYVADASVDLGIASCNQGSCYDCMLGQFQHTDETGDAFHEKAQHGDGPDRTSMSMVQ